LKASDLADALVDFFGIKSIKKAGTLNSIIFTPFGLSFRGGRCHICGEKRQNVVCFEDQMAMLARAQSISAPMVVG
jgi:hypothetical protein